MNNRSNRIFIWLALIPIVILVLLIWRFAINMPFADEWILAPYLQKCYQGTLTFKDLFQQHNESRMLFPRALMLGLAYLTDWNTNYELVLIILAAIAILLVLAARARRTCRTCLDDQHNWVIPVISALVFSLMQYACWSFGFTLVGYLSILFVIAGLCLLTPTTFSWIKFAGALLAGGIASYCYANGASFWIIGLLVLAYLSGGSRPRKSLLFLFFILFGAVIMGFYLAGYEKPVNHPGFSFCFENPGLSLSYLMVYLGGAIANAPVFPVWIPLATGIIGLVIFLIAASVCFTPGIRAKGQAAFWLGLATYALLTGGSLILSRSAFGISHALASRYTMFSGLFWIATLMTALISLKHAEHAVLQPARKKLLTACKMLLSVFAIICAALFIISAYASFKAWQQRYELMSAIRNELLSDVRDKPFLISHFWYKPWNDFAQQNRLSCFKEKKALAEYKLIKEQGGAIVHVEADLTNAVFSDGSFVLEGWAIDPLRHHLPAKAVLVYDTNELVVARTDVFQPRPGRNIAGKTVNWELKLKASKLPTGVSRLAVYALSHDDGHLTPIDVLELRVIPIEAINSAFQINKFIDTPDKTVGYFDRISAGQDQITVRGWARHPTRNEPAKWIVVVDESKQTLKFIRVNLPRPDVAQTFHQPSLLNSGWQVSFPSDLLSPGKHILSAYAYFPETKKAYKLVNDKTVTITKPPK